MAPTTLSWWACRLRREGRESGPALVPVRVVDAGASPADFVVRRGGGVEILVPASFDTAALQRLVVALEAPAC